MASKDLPPLASGMFSITVKSQLRTKPKRLPKTTDLSGKVVIITGGNTGIGFESARQFLSFNAAHIIIASRSEAKGKAAVSQLKQEYPKPTIETWALDMNSYESIHAFVKRVDSLSRLDIAVLNAGLNSPTFNIVPSTGHEELMQVNYLSTMLLSVLLLPILKAKSPLDVPGRLSIVSSGTVLMATFPNSRQRPLLKSFDDQKTSPSPGPDNYSTTKLMGQMFFSKFVEYVSPDDVIVNLVDPGITRGTEFLRHFPAIMKVIVPPLLLLIARSASEGASTYLDAAVGKGKESHGCFVMDWEIRP